MNTERFEAARAVLHRALQERMTRKRRMREIAAAGAAAMALAAGAAVWMNMPTSNGPVVVIADPPPSVASDTPNVPRPRRATAMATSSIRFEIIGNLPPEELKRRGIEVIDDAGLERFMARSGPEYGIAFVQGSGPILVRNDIPGQGGGPAVAPGVERGG